MALLKLSGIHKSFGATAALDGADLDLRRGEVLALIGENGAGKSTLMNILAGAYRPDTGKMEIGGREYAPANPLHAKRQGIAHIHQELSLCPHLSVAENILLGVEPGQFGWLQGGALLRRADELLANFGHTEVRADTRVADLPPSTRQIVEICRALAWDARIILMDEPTSSLQRTDVERLFATIRGLCAKGIAVIYISHFLEEVREITDRFTVLRDGRTVCTGQLSTTADGELIAHMVGRPVQSLFARRRSQLPGEVILEVNGLQAPPAVKNVSFELHRGEVLGIAGLVGSGRTELIRALFGLESAAAGEVKIRRQPVAAPARSPSRNIQQGMGYLSEDRNGEGLLSHLSIKDNLTLTRMPSCWGWIRSRVEAKQAADWMLRLKIKAPDSASPVRGLSGGNQQKVLLARLLHQDPDVLLLDEPTRGVDISSKKEIYEQINQLAAGGKAILMTSSYLPELFGISDRLAVMTRGTLSPALPIDQWTPDSVLQVAIGGEQRRERT